MSGTYVQVPLFWQYKNNPKTRKVVAETLIDLDDWEKVKDLTLCMHAGYAMIRDGYKKKRLHRFLLDAPSDMEVDHINMDRLDNRRVNLRLATKSENMRNTRVNKNNKLKLKGVTTDLSYYKDKVYMYYRARVVVNGQTYDLGRFKNPEDAARARDDFAKKVHGEFFRASMESE